jgi:hypothetical protein
MEFNTNNDQLQRAEAGSVMGPVFFIQSLPYACFLSVIVNLQDYLSVKTCRCTHQ